MKKWNALLQENLANAKKIEALKEQFLRQKQTYEHQLALSHSKIVQMNSAIPAVLLFTPLDDGQRGQTRSRRVLGRANETYKCVLCFTK